MRFSPHNPPFSLINHTHPLRSTASSIDHLSRRNIKDGGVRDLEGW